MLYYTHYSCSYPTLSDHSFMVYVECECGLDLETFRNQYPEKAAEMFKDFELARCVGHNFHKMHFGGSHGDIKESNYLVVPLSSNQQHLLHLPNGDQKMIKDYKIVLASTAFVQSFAAAISRQQRRKMFMDRPPCTTVRH